MVGADDYSHPDVNLILRSLPRWRHYYELQLHQPLCHQQLCHPQHCHQQHCHPQRCHQQHCHQQHCHQQCHRQHCHQQHCHQRLCRHPVGQQGMEGLHLVHEFFWWRIWVIPQFHCFFCRFVLLNTGFLANKQTLVDDIVIIGGLGPVGLDSWDPLWKGLLLNRNSRIPSHQAKPPISH